MAMHVRSNGGFDRYREHVPREVSDLIKATAAKIDDRAKAAAPRKTGTLKRSITHWMITPFAAVIGSRGVPYARIQDLGGTTSNQYGPNSGYIKGKFYLSAAFRNAIPEFQQSIRRILRGGV